MPYTITGRCICCHNCAMECPSHAINYQGMQYQIDPEKCTGCGECAEVCHISAITDTDNPPAPAPRHDPVTKTCDVVVLGGGTGLIAAVRAAQSGKRVVLLEKAKKVGGNTDLAHGFFPVYTKWHKQRGMADVRDEAVEEFHRRSGGVVDKDILRAAVYGCGEFFDWLCQYEGTDEAFELCEMGDVMAMGPMYGPGLVDFPKRLLENLNCRDQAIGPGWSGTFIKHAMLKECEKLGIEILTEHAAVKLLTNDSGAVTGVLAKDPGGETRINCKACIIATGGMGSSDEKLRRYFPGFFERETTIHRFSVPTDTGDGIDLAAPLGAEIPEDRMFCSIFGPAHHPFSYCIYRLMLQPECVYINLNGKRWQDETKGLMIGRHKIAEQPKEISYGIMSQKMVDEAAAFFLNDPLYRQEAWIYKDYQKDLDEESAMDVPVKKADSLEELATLMGVDPAVFLDEIRRYNDFCAKGCDEDFGKDPSFLKAIDDKGPYYAIYGQCFSEGAFGGLRVNPRTEVLNVEGKPIPGLYGVGDATSAVQVRGELAVISELTWATASAYIAGGNAAVYVERG